MLKKAKMTCRIRKIRGDEVCESLKGKLSRIHLKNGQMWPSFNTYQSQCYVYIAMHKNNILGWATLFDRDTVKSHMAAMFYVKRAYRRVGVGSSLMNAILSDNEGRHVYVYDYCCPDFFSKFELGLGEV